MKVPKLTSLGVCFLLAKLQTGYTKDILHLTILLKKKVPKALEITFFPKKKKNIKTKRKTIITQNYLSKKMFWFTN